MRNWAALLARKTCHAKGGTDLLSVEVWDRARLSLYSVGAPPGWLTPLEEESWEGSDVINFRVTL